MMKRARTGKIARLPHAIREQINQRLKAGETAPQVLAWLDTLPEVEAILKDEFGGRPISETNLAEWRRGGFAAWLESLAPREPSAAEPRKPVPEDVFKWAKERFDFDAQESRANARKAYLAHLCAEIERLTAFLPLRKAIALMQPLYHGLPLGRDGSFSFCLSLSRSTIKRTFALWQKAERKTPAVFTRKKGANADAA